MVRRRVVDSPRSGRSSKERGSSGGSIAGTKSQARALTYDSCSAGEGFPLDLAAVLLVTSVLLVFAFLLLTVSLMRLRGTTRELQAALDDESGARDRAALLLAIASAVNSSLALEEVLNVALTHAGRIMGAVAGAMYLVQQGKSEMKREAEYNLTHRARGGSPKLDDEPVRTAIAAMRPLVVKLDERTAPGIEGGGHPPHPPGVPGQRSGPLMGPMELYLNACRELTEDHSDLLYSRPSDT